MWQKLFSAPIVATTFALPLALAAADARAGSVTFNAISQFDPANNPSSTGPWSYGSLSSASGGTFTPFTNSFTDSFYTSIRGWSASTTTSFTGGAPNLFYAPDFTLLNNSGVLIGDVLGLTPGASDLSALRFTAAAYGDYSLSAQILGIYSNYTGSAIPNGTGTNANVNVYVNGSLVSSGVLFRQVPVSLSFTQTLSAGDTIDIAVQSLNGAAGFSPIFDAAQIASASVTFTGSSPTTAAVPLPLPMLGGASLLAFHFISRRRA